MQNMTYARLLLSLLQTAEGYGLNPRHVLDNAGISLDWLKLPFNKIPLRYLLTLFRVVHEYTGDDDIGLFAGKVAAAGNIYSRIHLLNISRNVRDFTKHMPSTDKFLGDIGESQTSREGDLICLQWISDPLLDNSERFLADMVMAFYASNVDALTARPIVIRACHFRYPRPKNIEALQNVFGTNLLFEQERNGFFIDEEVLEYPVIHLNKALLAEQPIESLFDQDERADPFMQELFDCVSRLLPSETLNVELIAAELGLSKRTLQRRLEEKQTKFKDVLMEVRERQAKRFLRDSHLSMTEIAFLLGYNSSATFSTAFKGWTNMTPSEYREQHGEGE